jgi:OmpA-OmpF porin, OOP family
MKRYLAAAVAGSFLISGCSALSELATVSSTVMHCGAAHGMELIVGAHRNAPAPALDDRLTCQVTAAIRAGKPVSIVVADSRPLVITPRLMSVTGGTLAQQDSPRVRQDVQRVQAALAAARPDSAGVDDLAALAVAADEARSSGGADPEFVLLDSGLDDRGALNFTVPGVVAATPAEVARQLRSSDELPDLHGSTVVLVGIGYTAPPQQSLSAKWRGNVTQIWTAVARSAGARVQVIPQPGQGPSVRTSEPVRAIPVPAIPQVRPARHTTIKFTGESAVRFVPNSPAFVDPAAAIAALTPIARWLAAGSSRRAQLEGTTADVGTLAAQIGLARLRADHVRDELIQLGGARTQLTTTGVGSRFPQFIRDRDAAGTLLAGPATLNRSVRITLS